MVARSIRVGVGIVALLALAGCEGSTLGNLPVESTVARDDDSLANQRARDGSILNMFGINTTVGPSAQRSDPLGASAVNRHLWLASLDTLSFLPIASTDPFSGVIATDWGGVTDSELERFRVTAFITATTLAPESLRVAVHREVRQPNGPWVTAPVAAETPRQIEDSILTRARQIRLAERGAS
jgi:hypothetical protein